MFSRIALLVLVPTVALAQRPVIEISGANFRPMPLAVAAPLTQDEGAKTASAEFDAALAFDFAACGLFQVLDRKSFLADPKEGITASTIQFNRWTDVGAESLDIVGAVETGPAGRTRGCQESATLVDAQVLDLHRDHLGRHRDRVDTAGVVGHVLLRGLDIGLVGT